MGAPLNNSSRMKENVVYSISNESKLRKLIFSKKINPISSDEYKKSRLNAYAAVK